jgi:hypothetical protein
LGRLIRLAEAYEGRAAFLLVAVTDANHPHPEGSPLEGEPTFHIAPVEDRLRLLRKGLDGYKVPFPAALDEDGRVERAYGGFPKRLLVIAGGRVVYDGRRGVKDGPSDWDLGEVERHLRYALGPEPTE